MKNKKIINVNELFNTGVCINVMKGQTLSKEALKYFDEVKYIYIDFTGIRAVMMSFLDAFIDELLKHHNIDEIEKKINILSAKPIIHLMYEEVIKYEREKK